MKVNERLKEYRINKNMSLRRVNKLTGFSIERLREFEKDPDLDMPEGMVKILAITYGVSFNKIINKI